MLPKRFVVPVEAGGPPARARDWGLLIVTCIRLCARSARSSRFLSERWWRYLQSYGPRPKHGFAEGDPYPKAAPRAARRDAWAPNGAQPGSDLDFTREHYLDACSIEYSIMAPLQPTGQADRNLDFGAAISTAVNDWQRAKWCEPEPRFKASIVIPYEDPPAAIAEIERCADDPAFAQILMLARTFEPLGSQEILADLRESRRGRLADRRPCLRL